jgi:hypothetical protein
LTNVVFFAIIQRMNEVPQPPVEQDPEHLGEILKNVDAIVGQQPDAVRQADTDVARLEAEVDELHTARTGMIEANQAGVAENDVTDITHATLEARAELDEAVKRHPSNPPE